jgi:H+-transporting ATPase
LIATGVLVANPTHILIVVLANDLVSMALTTDRVRPSLTPNRWQVGPMVASGLIMALAWLAFSFGIFFYGRDLLQLNAGQLQTLIFLMLVLVAQANVYLIRERTHFWNSRPSGWMILATTVGLTTVSLLALQGILMAPIGLTLLLQIGAATVVFAILLDFLKVKTFRHYAVT